MNTLLALPIQKSCPVLRKLEEVSAQSGVAMIEFSMKKVSDSCYIRYHTIKLNSGVDILTEQSDNPLQHTRVLVNGRPVRVEAFGEELNLEPFLKEIDKLFEINRRVA